MMGHHSKTLLFSGQFSVVDDEAQVDDLMSILKNEVGNKRNKNVDILSLASQICLKLNGKIMFFFFSLTTQKLTLGHFLYLGPRIILTTKKLFDPLYQNYFRVTLHQLQEWQGQDRDVRHAGAGQHLVARV